MLELNAQAQLLVVLFQLLDLLARFGQPRVFHSQLLVQSSDLLDQVVLAQLL